MKYLYILKTNEKHYKIGIAKNVFTRLYNIQTSNPQCVELVYFRLLDDAETIEQELHKELVHNKANGGNEWFELNDEDVIKLCIRLSKYPENINIDVLEPMTMLHKVSNQYSKINIKLKEIKKINEADRKKRIIINKPDGLINKPTKLTDDDIYIMAIEIIKSEKKASTSLLQRRLNIGYSRSARIIDRLEKDGYITEQDGSKVRQLKQDVIT